MLERRRLLDQEGDLLLDRIDHIRLEVLARQLLRNALDDLKGCINASERVAGACERRTFLVQDLGRFVYHAIRQLWQCTVRRPAYHHADCSRPPEAACTGRHHPERPWVRRRGLAQLPAGGAALQTQYRRAVHR
jgi:hypothetical protein